MALEEQRLDFLRDHRKLLLDRIPVAWELFQDSSVVFPARKQFLADWLLDSVYRLFKASANRYTFNYHANYLQYYRCAIKRCFLETV